MHCTRRSRIHLVAREVSSRSGSWRIWEAADMSVAATLSRHLVISTVASVSSMVVVVVI